jgi:hypothetical protein
MAALSDVDLVKILGENARAQIEAASESKTENPEVLRKRKLQSIEGQEFTAMALMIMGFVLFVSAYYTQVGMAFTIQCATATAALVGGIGWYLVLGKKKRAL